MKEIVQLPNKKYAIQKGYLFKKYLDLCSTYTFWYSRTSGHFPKCLGTKEKCQEVLDLKYTKIKNN